MQWKAVLTAPLLFASVAGGQVSDATKQLSREIFRELIEINTTDSVGDNTAAAHAVAKRFLDAGFAPEDVRVLTPEGRPKKGNLVVKLHGAPGGTLPPILLLGHLDVVEAKREDWTTNPFQFVEKDGYFYGRGTVDMKDYDAVMITALLRFKQEGFVPNRDIVLALTSDEEGGPANGVNWLLKNHRELLTAAYALNGDSGGVTTDNGKAVDVRVGAAEKIYADFQLTVTSPGGHSSRPTPDNAIYVLAEALEKLARAPFPFELNPVVKAYFAKVAAFENAQSAADMRAITGKTPDAAAVARLSQDPRYNSLLHTTCVPTRLNAGHANNALPQIAQAIVNCRILPGHSPEEARLELVRKVANNRVTVSYVDGATGALHEHAPDEAGLPPSEPTPEVLKPLERVVDALWPGAGVVPSMASGASDSKYTIAAGIPSYGVGEIAVERNDDRSHGKDERVRVSSFYQAVDFFDRYLRALTSTR